MFICNCGLMWSLPMSINTSKYLAESRTDIYILYIYIYRGARLRKYLYSLRDLHITTRCFAHG